MFGSEQLTGALLDRLVEDVHNARRRHCALGYKSLVDFEVDHARPKTN